MHSSASRSAVLLLLSHPRSLCLFFFFLFLFHFTLRGMANQAEAHQDPQTSHQNHQTCREKYSGVCLYPLWLCNIPKHYKFLLSTILLCRRFKVSSTCLLLKTNKPALESWQTATFSGLLVSVVWNFLLTSKVQYIFCANLCFETNDAILCLFCFVSTSHSCVFNQSRYQLSSSLGRKKLSIIKLRLD